MRVWTVWSSPHLSQTSLGGNSNTQAFGPNPGSLPGWHPCTQLPVPSRAAHQAWYPQGQQHRHGCRWVSSITVSSTREVAGCVHNPAPEAEFMGIVTCRRGMCELIVRTGVHGHHHRATPDNLKFCAAWWIQGYSHTVRQYH